MLLLGDDFSFKNYSHEMIAWDSVLIAMNSNGKALFKGSTFRMATAGEYFDALGRDKNTPPQKTIQDFYPLIDLYFNMNPVPWTGYFTTRPHLKRMMKKYGQIVRGASDLVAVFSLENMISKDITIKFSQENEWMRWLVGVNTHHDAITGTCERHVCEDYLDRISQQIKQMDSVISKYLTLPLLGVSVSFEQTEDGIDLSNFTTAGVYRYVIFSTSSSKTQKVVKVRVGRNFDIRITFKGKFLQRTAKACDTIVGCEHSFNFEISGRSMNVIEIETLISESFASQELVMTGETRSISFSNGKQLNFKINKDEIILEERESATSKKRHLGILWLTYAFSKDWCSLAKHAAGSYVFSTCDYTAKPISIEKVTVTRTDDWVTISVTLTDIRIVGHITFDSKQESGLRVTVKSNIARFKSSMRELDYILRVFSPIDNGEKFTTDSNGLENLERKYGGVFGSSPEYNYYPITTHISIEDKQNRLTLFTDRSVGGSSVAIGSVEVMLQRVNKERDRLGIISKLLEPYPVTVECEVLLENVELKDSEMARAIQVDREAPLLYAKLIEGNGDLKAEEVVSTIVNRVLQNLEKSLRVTFDAQNKATLVRVINMSQKNSANIEFLRDPFFQAFQKAELDGNTHFARIKEESESYEMIPRTATKPTQQTVPELNSLGIITLAAN